MIMQAGCSTWHQASEPERDGRSPQLPQPSIPRPLHQRVGHKVVRIPNELVQARCGLGPGHTPLLCSPSAFRLTREGNIN